MNYFYEMKTGRKFQNNCLTLIFAQNWGKYRSTTVRNFTHFDDTQLNSSSLIHSLTLIFAQNSGEYRSTAARNSIYFEDTKFNSSSLI